MFVKRCNSPWHNGLRRVLSSESSVARQKAESDREARSLRLGPQTSKKCPRWPGGVKTLALVESLGLLAATVVLRAVDLARFSILLPIHLLLFLRRQLAAISNAILLHFLVDLLLVVLETRGLAGC